MVRYSWFLGCCLVGFLGLAPSASAGQAEAQAACAAYVSSFSCPSGHTKVVDQGCTATPNPDGGSNFYSKVVCSTSNGSYSPGYTNVWQNGGSNPPSVLFRASYYNTATRNYVTFGDVVPGFSNLPYTPWVVAGGGGSDRQWGQYWGFTDGNSEPDCPDWTAGEFSGWKAPTPNGSGNVCIDGCLASIALSPPPGPLYLGEWQGQTCTVSDAPAPLPSEDSTLPDDPEAPGTGEPGDPNAPPGTGGGGFHCDAPPVCNGDGVTCSMLYQQWRHRCTDQSDGIAAQEGFGNVVDSVTGGADSVGSKVDATTSAVNEAGLKIDGTTAAVNEVSNRLDGIGDNIAGIQTQGIETNNQLTGLRGDLEGAFSDGGVGADESVLGGLVGGVTLSTDAFDDSGWGLSRSCPRWDNITFSLGGRLVTIPLANFEGHCTIFEWSGFLLLALSAYVALRIFIKE